MRPVTVTQGRVLYVGFVRVGQKRGAAVTARNVEILKQIYEALGRGEVGPVLLHFDRDVVSVEPETEGWAARGGHFGVGAVADELLGAVPEEFETLVLRLERLIGGIDSVVVTGRYWTRGEGARADVSFMHLWELRGGKVTGFGIFKDHAAPRLPPAGPGY